MEKERFCLRKENEINDDYDYDYDKRQRVQIWVVNRVYHLNN